MGRVTYGEDMPSSTRCPVEGCVERKGHFALLCDGHMERVPGDLFLAFDIGWKAARVGSHGEYRVAVHHREACIDYVNKLEAEDRAALVAGDGGLSGEGNPL